MKQSENKYLLFLLIGLFAVSISIGFFSGNAIAEDRIWYKAVPFSPGKALNLTEAPTINMVRMKLDSPGTNYSSDDLQVTVNGLADRLLNSQDANGGWREILSDSGSVADNIVGAVALGMLRAYIMNMKIESGAENYTDGTVYLDSAKKAADYLTSLPADDQLSANDCIFLNSLAYWMDTGADVTQNAYYQSALAEVNQLIVNNGSTEDAVADNLYNAFTVVPQLKHWWIANWIEAFQLFNSASFADALVEKVFAENDFVEGNGETEKLKTGAFVYDDDNNVRTLSHSRMIEVLAKYYSGQTITANSTDYVIDTVIREGINFLKDIQTIAVSGAFRIGARIMEDGTVKAYPTIYAQDQAFAVSAMVYGRQTKYDNYTVAKGPYWGAKYLMDTAEPIILVDPSYLGYVYSDGKEYAEDNAEALYALYASCKEGDVDKSGAVMSGDALAALKASMGVAGKDLSGPAFVAADRNGDGYIDPDDALKILKHSVGLPIEIPYI